MQVIFRVDASLEIGMGHVMRCLTLAEGLSASGVQCSFISREHQGNLIDQIKQRGFNVFALSAIGLDHHYSSKNRTHAAWLGCDWKTDAEQVESILQQLKTDWLVVDHYALDYNWEKSISFFTSKIMVIDDLANRSHFCNLLLDQNYCSDQSRYDSLLSPGTSKLLGPKYALLRKCFKEKRKISECKQDSIRNVFIFFGGSDSDNLTSRALRAIDIPNLKHLSVDVVIGSANPHYDEVRQLANLHPNANLHIQVENIAELMNKADISLGAGGITTWERMAMGLPSIVITIAENQVSFTRELDQDGYIKWLGNSDQVKESNIYNALLEAIQNPHKLDEQSKKGQELVDGMGAQTISKLMTDGSNY